MVLMAAMSATTVMAAKDCGGLPTEGQLRSALIAAYNPASPNPALGGLAGPVGGIYRGTRMWGAIVNRDGEICTRATSTSDPTQVWPGSQAIAKAKAYTANAFSLDDNPNLTALSTAMLYTLTLPGHSLWSLGQSNLFDPSALAPPDDGHGGKSDIAGGLIFFGGGVALYKNGKIVGGLGISGDTSCADHEIAKRARHLLGLDPPGGPTSDDINYSPGLFQHPTCLNTYRNGALVNAAEVPVALP